MSTQHAMPPDTPTYVLFVMPDGTIRSFDLGPLEAAFRAMREVFMQAMQAFRALAQRHAFTSIDADDLDMAPAPREDVHRARLRERIFLARRYPPSAPRPEILSGFAPRVRFHRRG